VSYVTIRQLTKRFDSAPVFSDIDLDIDRGEMCVLVGPSGCGKTTLLRAIAGLTKPNSGTITIDGIDITGRSARDRDIGMVFQHYALFPNMTVEQNLVFGLEQKGCRPDETRRRVTAMIELMGLGERARARPSALSGGQKQRVALARALVLEPKLLLLDEPMSALDAQIRKRLREELKRLQREVGFTAMFVTHDQEEALVLGDKIAVMQAGHFAQVGTPVEIYNRPASRLVANFIGDFNVLEQNDIRNIFGGQSSSAWAVHPESVEFANGNSDSADHLSASALIRERQVLGSVVRYLVSIGPNTLKMDVLNRPSAVQVKPGAIVQIRIARADVRELAG
jgi:putative spermidine/putrescine transport system ATP-binding protein